MANSTESAGSTVVGGPKRDLAQEARNQVNAILAQTDWGRYWEEVSERVAAEVDAYEVARARSLEEGAHQVFL